MRAGPPTAARIEIRQVARPTAGAHPPSPRELNNGEHVCPPGVPGQPFSRAAPSRHSRRRRSRGIPGLAGQYAQSFAIDAQERRCRFCFSSTARILESICRGWPGSAGRPASGVCRWCSVAKKWRRYAISVEHMVNVVSAFEAIVDSIDSWVSVTLK